jgi:ArsR family transcriptional regulator
MNLLKESQRVADILKTISPAARLAILLAIGEGEACVCHLEAVLGKRQAYISQHLMALRQAEILLDRRDGRFVYYRIADPALLDLVRSAAKLAGIETGVPTPSVMCVCPHCTEAQPGYLPLTSIDIAQPESTEGNPR